jgi:hypothetical protein
MYYKARTIVEPMEDNTFNWKVELKVYAEKEIFCTLESNNPVKCESRARLTALKALLEHMLLENNKEVNLLYYCDRKETYDEYISYVLKNSIKWWVDGWRMRDGYNEYSNVDMLKEIVVPLLVPCFERIQVVSVNNTNKIF